MSDDRDANYRTYYKFSLNELTLLQMACEFFIAHEDHGERSNDLALDNNRDMKLLCGYIATLVE